MKHLDRIERVIAEIRAAGYAVKRDGMVVLISHPRFSKPLPMSIAKLRPAKVVPGLDAYRKALIT
jgi:hypothetical protein